jgi:transposase
MLLNHYSRYVKSIQDQLKSVEIIGFELVLGKIYDEIGFNEIDSSIFRALVLTRVSHPGSKLKAVEYMRRNHGVEYDLNAVYRFMDKLHSDYGERVQQISFDHTKTLFGGKIAVVFYDVTTLYFEAEQEDDLRKLGYSKDGKIQRPQIVLGLLVSEGGYPLAFQMFAGNTFEGKTMLQVVDQFEKQYQIDNTFIIADAAMLSRKNLDDLEEKERKYIVGARIKSESNQIKQKILDLSLSNGQSKVIEKPDGTKLIISMSDKRASKDAKNRQRGVNRLEKLVRTGKLTKTHINNRGYNKFLEMSGKVQVIINRFKINEDKKWDGLKGYITNSDLSNEDVIKHYSELWQIEKAFRVSKTDLRMRPIFHRLERRIRAHLIIAFSAYKVYKELERQLQVENTGISITKAIRLMGSILGITVQNPESNQSHTLIFTNNAEHQPLLDTFKIKKVSH